MNLQKPDDNCRVERLISAVYGRWKLLILFWLGQGPCRFNQLQRHLGKVTHRTLTRQLGELQEAGFVHREDFQTIPPHVEYSLTPLGQSLMPLLEAMHGWAVENADKMPAADDQKQKPGANRGAGGSPADPVL